MLTLQAPRVFIYLMDMIKVMLYLLNIFEVRRYAYVLANYMATFKASKFSKHKFYLKNIRIVNVQQKNNR